jgi:hypothetical protein
MFTGDTLDAVADGIAWVALIVGPIIVIAVFWLIHILPEKIAEARKHPQKKAIHTLCILSLFFGGLLWPLAFLWAYSKPVLYKLAYGTDVADPEGHGEAGGEASSAEREGHEAVDGEGPRAEPHAARMIVVAERQAEPGTAAATRESA